MKIRKFICLLSVLCLVATVAEAKVRLPKLISDGIVFQRNAPINVWGFASPRETVIVTFMGQTYRTKADKKGNWMVTMKEESAGGPYVMQVNDLEVKDILIGEVWLCSGQSNMETPMGRVAERFEDEVTHINNPMIHHFKTDLHFDVTHPDNDLNGVWKEATQENIMSFSATAYFFGKYLYQHFKVPIGLFNSSVGGSPIEAWLSSDAAKLFPKLEQQLKELNNKALQDSIRQAMGKMFTPRPRPVDAGTGKWLRADWNDNDWPNIYLPGYFGEKNIPLHNGAIWLRKTVDLPASCAGKAGRLRLGTLVNSDSAFINNRYVGNTTYQYPPRNYTVPAGILKAGKNVVVVRIEGNSRAGFVEEKPYYLIVGKDSFNLTGNWKYNIGYDTPPMQRPARRSGAPFRMPPIAGQNSPTALYNAMIAPALHYVFKGVLWYQGEANAGQWMDYGKYFEAMVNDWRTKFGKPDMPFLYVQLPNFMDPERYQAHSDWAALRNVQRLSLSIPHVGMAIALGLGEWNDIHPLNKRDLGYRISLVARKVAYGETGFVSNGPLYKSMEIKDDGSIILTFESVGTGIYPNLRLRGFEIAGKDGNYVDAQATPLSKNQVKVWSPQVKQPVSVRYAWAQNPIDANLRNNEGLPASTFEAK